MTTITLRSTPIPPIYIVSGGVGASGEQLVQTVLAQFREVNVPVSLVGNVRQREQIERVVGEAGRTGGTIVHTLVDSGVREWLVCLARDRGVVEIDLMGPLLARLVDVLQQEPLQQPGLYRRLHRAHFQRVVAIQFALDHDDGRNSQEWSQADIVLTGVSRAGKTPISVYLSVLGWKVANCPLVPEIPTPRELFELDPGRVIGLCIGLDQLLMLRQQRYSRMGAFKSRGYVDPEQIEDELKTAERIFARGHFTKIDVSDKPIETTAEEIIQLITRRFPAPA